MNPSSFSQHFRRVSVWLSIPLQVVAWLIYMGLPFWILSLPQVISPSVALTIFSVKAINDLMSICFFYLNLYWFTPYVLKKQAFFLFVLVFVGLVLGLYLIDTLYYRYFLRDVLTDVASRLPASPIVAVRPVWGVPLPISISSILSLVLLTTISSALAIYRDRAQHVSAGQQMIIEKQDAELFALKLQISPHFLFNTLNNLRWLARQKSHETEATIQRLSELMRYMIYQTDKGPVSLANEIEYLEHYIELQKMRLSDNNRLSFVVSADNPQIVIEPLLFIHFVENAFKHGLHAEEDSLIDIQLTLSQGHLHFQTRNPLFHTKLPATDSGIGIQNSKRRLALHYPGRHELRIDQRAGLFCVDLTIDLTGLPSPPSAHEATMHSH